MKAVYTYWSKEQDKNTCGFNSFEDFLTTMSLSVNIASNHFKEIELVTNSFGKYILIDILKLPFTSVNLELDKWDNLPSMFWTYPKILAYSLQKEPFIHIDNDVFLWSGIPEKCLKNDLYFQSKEWFGLEGFGWYHHLVDLMIKKAPFKPQFIVENLLDVSKNSKEYTFNCGIVGCNSDKGLKIIERWKDLSTQYVLSLENLDFFNNADNLQIHQNLLHEQYFVGCLLKAENLLDNVGVLLEDYNKESTCGNYKYTHLWGLVKRDSNVMNKVYKRLRADFSLQYDRIFQFIMSKEIFIKNFNLI